MILNAQALLLAFVAVLRLACSVLVLGLGASAWREGHRPTADQRTAHEDRGYLLLLLGVVVVAMNLVSWPLLYLLLQSYVSEWPGVMCVYGVTQVGKGSLGISRFLPDLLRMLQLTKPGLVFAGGAWFVLYLLNRRTRTGPLAGRLLLLLLALGALGAADAAAELAYVAIPKKEVFPSGGCCTAAEDPERFLPPVLLTEAGRTGLSAAYYGGNVGLILGLLAATRSEGRPPGSLGLLMLTAAGLVVLAVGGLFLHEVAAPTLLQLPYHHCPYDLIPRVPEAVAAIALFLGGCFFLGWAGVAGWLGRSPETAALLPGVVHRLLRLSLWCYLASLVMLSLELALS